MTDSIQTAMENKIKIVKSNVKSTNDRVPSGPKLGRLKMHKTIFKAF